MYLGQVANIRVIKTRLSGRVLNVSPQCHRLIKEVEKQAKQLLFHLSSLGPIEQCCPHEPLARSWMHKSGK